MLISAKETAAPVLSAWFQIVPGSGEEAGNTLNSAQIPAFGQQCRINPISGFHLSVDLSAPGQADKTRILHMEALFIYPKQFRVPLLKKQQHHV